MGLDHEYFQAVARTFTNFTHLAQCTCAGYLLQV